MNFADSEEEALTFFGAIERRYSLAGLKLDEVEDLEPRPGEPKGVYWMSGHVLYASDE